MYPYFIWKNISSLDKNIMVNKLPNFERPPANIEKIVISGRDGFLTQDDGTYQGTVKTCECSLDNGNIEDICSWLTGCGDVTFSNEPDKIYKAVIINKIPFSKIIPTFHSFIIQWDCQPQKYSISNDIITLTTVGTITNPATAIAKPIIKVYGTGTINLTINSTAITLTNVVDYVTIDSELQDAYHDTQLFNNDMVGEFPILQVGTNTINWSGAVIKIEIQGNWRF